MPSSSSLNEHSEHTTNEERAATDVDIGAGTSVGHSTEDGRFNNDEIEASITHKEPQDKGDMGEISDGCSGNHQITIGEETNDMKEVEDLTRNKSRSRIQPLEIHTENELNKNGVIDENVVDIGSDDDMDDDNDMEGLLEPQKGTKTAEQMNRPLRTGTARCCESQRIGNTTVFWPYMYKKSGWGMMGMFQTSGKAPIRAFFCWNLMMSQLHFVLGTLLRFSYCAIIVFPKYVYSSLTVRRCYSLC